VVDGDIGVDVQLQCEVLEGGGGGDVFG